MDSLITAAARALASGDALGALNHIALRNDAPALALRGIAMAQLGDLDRAKTLLRRAARAFGTREAVARARCVVAEAEIALVSRDLNWPVKALNAAQAALERHGDRTNAAHARYLAIRGLMLIGRLDAAERLQAGFDPVPLLPASRAAYELAITGIAMRRLKINSARAALMRADLAARRASIPSLTVEVENAARSLDMPAARLIARGGERLGGPGLGAVHGHHAAYQLGAHREVRVVQFRCQPRHGGGRRGGSVQLTQGDGVPCHLSIGVGGTPQELVALGRHQCLFCAAERVVEPAQDGAQVPYEG